MMSHSLANRQQQLMAYLIGENSSIDQHIVDQGNVTIETRLAIYRNAYRIRLKKTIETDHEILGLYLGDDLFDEMVDGYIDTYASDYTSLRQYADKLPQYLAITQPFANHPLTSELATFERLLLTAFDAADTPRMSQSELSAIPVDQWPDLQFRFHPSMQLFTPDWNTVETWQALKVNETPPAPEKQQPIWLIWRNQERLTEFHSISGEEFQLISHGLQGKSLAELCELLLDNHPAENTSQIVVNYLFTWIQRGILILHTD